MILPPHEPRGRPETPSAVGQGIHGCPFFTILSDHLKHVRTSDERSIGAIVKQSKAWAPGYSDCPSCATETTGRRQPQVPAIDAPGAYP
ncbi:hypothetical protein PGT21_020908 [Puccinia graminis f. sp. tritici]|uniref:Uncharacterized protein n=1 Tax=Puccinia graminis f. sp. tritici TaxID=56615 RepID=A0A5B0QBD4_PUCGR|nr:hypothetical protein PGT21_020908 [Puccinia graminis f. sp. tritici]